jgi:hypothetical protein
MPGRRTRSTSGRRRSINRVRHRSSSSQVCRNAFPGRQASRYQLARGVADPRRKDPEVRRAGALRPPSPLTVRLRVEPSGGASRCFWAPQGRGGRSDGRGRLRCAPPAAAPNHCPCELPRASQPVSAVATLVATRPVSTGLRVRKPYDCRAFVSSFQLMNYECDVGTSRSWRASRSRSGFSRRRLSPRPEGEIAYEAWPTNSRWTCLESRPGGR